MSDFTPQVAWSGKDALSDGDSNKIISGSDFNTEFSGVQTAVNSKYDSSDLSTALQPYNADTALYVVGEIKMWPTMTPPTGWLICNDANLLRAGTYADLFAVIGTTYGSDDGTHFNLPDFRGRSAVGVSEIVASDGLTGDAADATVFVLADKDGTEGHTLLEAEMPAHTHVANNATGAGNAGPGSSRQAGTTPGTSGSTGGDGAHENRSPSLAINYIIRY